MNKGNKTKAAKWATRYKEGKPMKGQKRRNARRAAGKDGYRAGTNA